ncbi:MAG: tRNA pseudouridine(38-40) synthase TruA [Deltaproteobacteria bacterium]|nr:tRNA pseudouridine(38-40) synthase TruA [Deltaproteobacteria bacterium]
MTLSAEPSRPSVLLTVAYDGTHFHGFAPQPGTRTVYGELLEAVRKLDPSVTALRGVSRTDAGVHAYGQRVAFDPQQAIPPRGWALGLARHLPPDLSVRSAGLVPAGYDPRGHSVAKHYRYALILDVCRDPLLERTAWRLATDFDLELAREQAAALVGTHDFAAFRSSADMRTSTERTLHAVTLERAAHDARLVLIDVRGSAFLHNMVRIIAGSLADLGRGRLAPGAFERAFASRARADLGITAPPQGLCLQSVQLEPDAADSWPRA